MHVIAIVILAYICSYAYSSDESQFVCKKMSENMTPNPVLSPGSNVHRNRPGKKGPKGDRGGTGLKGERGEKGETCIVDYAKINETIKLYIKEMLKEIDTGTVEEKVAEEPQNPIKANCGITYNGKCYIPEMKTYANESKAKEICSEMGGKLANIYSAAQFNHVTDAVVKDHLGRYSASNFRIGLTVNPQNFVTKLSDGTSAPYLPWGRRFPLSTPGHTSVYLEVGRTRSYLHNREPTWAPYTLCEI